MKIAASPDPSTERKIVSDAGKLTAAQAISYAVNLVGTLFLANLLGRTLFGAWKFIQLIMYYTSFSNLGANYGLDKICPSLISARRGGTYRRVIASSLGFSAIVSVLLAVGAAWWGIFMPKGPQRVAVLAFSVLLLIQPFYNHADTALSVEKRFGLKAKAFLGYNVSRVVLSVLGAWALSLTGALAAWILTMGAAAVYMWRGVSARPAPLWNPAATRRAIDAGLPICLILVGEQVLTTADKLIVSLVLGFEDFGLYQMAIFPLPILLLAPFALRQVVSIDIYDKYGQTNRVEDAREVFDRSVLAIALGTPLVIGAVYFGVPWLIEWQLPDFAASIPTLKDHAVLIFPILVCQTAFAVAIIRREEKRLLLASLAVAGLSSVLSLLIVLPGRGGYHAVLWVHGLGWLIFGSAFLYRVRRWFGDDRTPALMGTAAWFLPMAYLALELPLLSGLVQWMGYAPSTFLHAVIGGALHTLACLPLLLLLERRTKGLSFIFRAGARRLHGFAVGTWNRGAGG